MGSETARVSRGTASGVLPHFGARYYGSALGRYTGPDEPFADQRSIDPQSWNLYTYAANNPLKYIDKTGKAIELAGDDEQRKKQLAALQSAVGKKAGSYLYDNAEKDKDGNLTGRHFVGILGGGPSGKGPDFSSINSAAADVAGVVGNTQIAQIHLMDAGAKLHLQRRKWCGDQFGLQYDRTYVPVQRSCPNSNLAS